MPQPRFDVLGIGNAIVDILADAPEGFLDEQGMTKGSMALVDADRARAIYAGMGAAIEASGGSAANTIAGVASLGGKAAFVGKVRADQFGTIFAHDLQAMGVHYATPAATDGPPTAQCLILVSPDAQRTMNTYLGACANLTPDDIEPALVADAAITYLEGYLFDPPHAKEAFRKAATAARTAGRKVALSLSDSFCVGRYRAEFVELVRDHIDILFANEAEIGALYETDDLDAAIAEAARHVEIVAVTRGGDGSVLRRDDEMVATAAASIDRLVDTTGAGDLYAAGVLYGLSRNLSLAESGRIGSLAAAEIIGHFGARPEIELKALLG